MKLPTSKCSNMFFNVVQLSSAFNHMWIQCLSKNYTHTFSPLFHSEQSVLSNTGGGGGPGSQRRVSLTVPGRRRTPSQFSYHDTIDSVADSASNVSVYKPQHGPGGSVASVATAK